MTTTDDVRRYIRLMEDLFSGTEEPVELKLRQLRLVRRLSEGESIEAVSDGSGYTSKKLLTWTQALADTGLWHWLGKKREPDVERWKRAKGGIAQMLLGLLAEGHFEAVSKELLAAQGFRVEDQRVGRTDTDYRLLDAQGRPVCRLNIKFHGTLFKQAREYVSLEPQDCFALATYKIHGALQRQQDERLPYIFLIISVPDYPREWIEHNVAEDWAWLAALSGRLVEEQIARRLSIEPWTDTVRDRIRQSEFRVISARRASNLLRDQLFRRVHALRLRAFNQLFRGAEINMHLSLSTEMIGYAAFVRMLADLGVLNVALGLDRGDI